MSFFFFFISSRLVCVASSSFPSLPVCGRPDELGGGEYNYQGASSRERSEPWKGPLEAPPIPSTLRWTIQDRTRQQRGQERFLFFGEGGCSRARERTDSRGWTMVRAAMRILSFLRQASSCVNVRTEKPELWYPHRSLKNIEKCRRV